MENQEKQKTLNKMVNLVENETLITDKKTYQKNRRYMAWTALVMMVVATIAVLVSPARFASAEAILMMMYGSLSALVASYFGFSKK
jgi:hypothetical protein